MIEKDTLKKIRNKNISDVLQVLRCNGACTLSEMTDEVDGGLTTVKKCVAQAIDYGMVVEGNIAESTGGRKARQFLINKDYQYYFIAVVDNNNLIIKVYDFAISCVEDYQKSFNLNSFFSVLCKEIEKQAKKYTIGTIGISIPCVVKNGIVLDWYYNPGMIGFDIKSSLEEKYKVNVVVQNDMKLTALGVSNRDELNSSNIITMQFGHNGVGMAGVVNGHLIEGKNGFSGEVGYISDITKNIMGISYPAKLVRNAIVFLNPETIVCYSDWENKYKFYQTIRFVNGSRVSIRYYHFYKCLSIYIDSLPGLLYGSSQELYKYSDYPHFKKILSDLLNGVTGLDEFKPDVWDYARIVRLDLNQDYYFSSKSNEEKFREWIGKFNMPYGKDVVYNSGKKNGTKSTNLTCYSKDEQLKTKYRNFENPYSHKCFCTRVEFQLKANYWKSNKIYLLNILSNNCEKKTFFDMMVNKMNMNGAIMNNGQFYYFLKKIQQEKRKDFAENIKKFYNELSKSGFSKAKKLPSYKNYIKYTTESGKNPIKISDSVYKELVELKDIYYSEKN